MLIRDGLYTTLHRRQFKDSMNRIVIQKPNILHIVSLIQVLLLFFYLALNIINIGESGGAALPLLAAFFLLSLVVFFIQAMTKTIVIHTYLLFFLLFILWLALRVVIDLSDIQYLKEITIGTTGGIMLFFIIGTLSKPAIDIISKTKESLFGIKIVLLGFLAISLLILYDFKARLLERVDIFYIEGVDGGYQRPGNFLIMIFIIASFSYLSTIIHKNTKKKFSLLIWIIVYSMGFSNILVSSQMIGSNAATVNIVAIYLITIVLSLLSFNKKIRLAFFNDKVSSLFSKRLISILFKYSFITIMVIFIIAFLVIQVTGFDLSRTRILGFGTGKTNSIDSRSNIFKETGVDQLSYSPIFGDINVSKVVTGDTGLFLHNFLPNIMAELGLFGLLIVIIIFFLVFLNLIENIKNNSKDAVGLQNFIVNIWFFFTLLFLFIYANIAVSKSWIVIWFYIGFAVKAISIKIRVNKKPAYL